MPTNLYSSSVSQATLDAAIDALDPFLAPDPSGEDDGAPLIVDGGGYTFSSILADDWATNADLPARDQFDQLAKLPATAGGALIKTGSALIKGAASSVLTGSIDPAASTTVTGVGTLFLSELKVGDRITVTGETRTVTAIASDTSLTVDYAFSDGANDTSPDRLAAVLSALLSNGTLGLELRSDGSLELLQGNIAVKALGELTFGNPRSTGDANGFRLVNANASGFPRMEFRGLDNQVAATIGFDGAALPATTTGALHVGSYFKRNVSFVTAAGSVQADALQLDSSYDVYVISSAAAGTGVKMVAAFAVATKTLVNKAANAVKVWPTSGDDIGAGVDAYVYLPVGGTVEFICEDTTTWWPLWSSPRKVLQIVRAAGDETGNEATQSATLVETSLKKSITVRAGTIVRIRALIYILIDATGISGGRLGFVGLHRDTTAGELVAANGTEILPEYENGHALALDATTGIHYAMLMYEWEEASPGAGTYEYTVCIRRGASTSGRVTYQNVAVKDSFIEITEEAVTYG